MFCNKLSPLIYFVLIPSKWFFGGGLVMYDFLVFLYSTVDCLLLLGLSVYYIITLSDLECDFINPSTCCKRLNKMVLPEIFGLVSSLILYLCTFKWYMLTLLAPLSFWTLYKFVTVPSSNTGLYDPIEIYNSRVLYHFMKISIAKTAFYLLWFFVSLYSLINWLSKGSSLA